MINIDYIPILTPESCNYVINSLRDFLKKRTSGLLNLPSHKLVCRELLPLDLDLTLKVESHCMTIEGITNDGTLIAIYGYEVVPETLHKYQLTLIDFEIKGALVTRLSFERLYIPEKIIEHKDGDRETIYRTALYLVSPIVFEQHYKIIIYGSSIPADLPRLPIHFLGLIIEPHGRTVTP